MGITPVATSLSMRFASTAPTLAAAIAVSAFNLGIALGSLIAGGALESSLGPAGPGVVGAIMVALGLIPLAVLALIRADRTPDPAAETSDDLVTASTHS